MFIEKIVRLARKLKNVTHMVIRNSVSYYPPIVVNFETDFAKFVNAKHSITFCNGTSTIEAALFSIGVQGGDEVIAPSLTFHASISPILNAGAQPVFADVNATTLTLDVDDVRQKITSQTKCIIVVHVFGYPADMASLIDLAKKHELAIIEDCSHAHGASINGKLVGTFGDIGCFSLQGNKPISAGEGGIAVTNSQRLFDRMRLFGHFGRSSDAFVGTKYEIASETGLGYKRRANPLGICLAAVDLLYIDRKNKRKAYSSKRLDEIVDRLDSLHRVSLPAGATRGGFHWGYPALIDEAVADEMGASSLIRQLRKNGVQAEKYPYGRYHLQSHMFNREIRNQVFYGRPRSHVAGQDNQKTVAALPKTDSIYDRLIFLPILENPRESFFATLSTTVQKSIAEARRLSTDSPEA